MPTTPQAETLAAWGNKRLARMTKPELVAALNDLWRAYNAVNRRTIGPSGLATMPDHDLAAIEARLGVWFLPKD